MELNNSEKHINHGDTESTEKSAIRVLCASSPGPGHDHVPTRQVKYFDWPLGFSVLSVSPWFKIE